MSWQVVNDDDVQPVFGVQAPGLRAHFQRTDRRRVVNEQVGVSQDARGFHQDGPFIVVDIAQAQALLVNAGLEESRRCTNCSADISRLKKATRWPSAWSVPAATLRARLVLLALGAA